MLSSVGRARRDRDMVVGSNPARITWYIFFLLACINTDIIEIRINE